MSRVNWSIKLFLLACLCLVAVSVEAELSRLLDGRVYVGTNGEIGHDADRSDKFIFKDGYFVSASCDEYQFTSGKYTTRRDGNIIYFEAALARPAEKSAGKA